jgi:hypothetical protein
MYELDKKIYYYISRNGCIEDDKHIN